MVGLLHASLDSLMNRACECVSLSHVHHDVHAPLRQQRCGLAASHWRAVTCGFRVEGWDCLICAPANRQGREYFFLPHRVPHQSLSTCSYSLTAAAVKRGCAFSHSRPCGASSRWCVAADRRHVKTVPSRVLP